MAEFRFTLFPEWDLEVLPLDVYSRTGKVKVPEHMDLVKTARFKELAPYDPDWFYVRCAAVLRHIYIRSPVGVKTVTKIFGGRKRNGVTPSHFCRYSHTLFY